jgi:hypothetical protein
MDESQMIVYPAKNEKHKVTVFTDIDCPYCVKLHRDMKDYNVEILIDGPEVPIMDGSAMPFVNTIEHIGTLEIRDKRKAIWGMNHRRPRR